MKRWLPDARGWIDAALLVALSGLALAGLAAASYAALILGLKRFSDAGDPIHIVLWQSAVAAVVLLPAFGPTLTHSLSARSWLYLVLLGVVLTGVSGLIYVAAIRAVPARAMASRRSARSSASRRTRP